jgi:hypothetical protein
MKIKLWNKGYVTDEVSSVPLFEANLSEENRVKWVTDLAAVSRGKTESKNPEKRYKMLLKEAAPDRCDSKCEGEPSRPLEFLPVILEADTKEYLIYNVLDNKPFVVEPQKWFDYIMGFSYVDYDSRDLENPSRVKIYTNMRACIKAGIPYELIPYNTAEEIKNGKWFAVKSYTPMFVWAQDKTHCKISSESASGRVVRENDYWLPHDIKDKIVKANENDKIIIIDPEILENVVKQQLEQANNTEITPREAALELFDNMIYSNEVFAIPSYVLFELENNNEQPLIDLLLNWSQNKVTRFFEILGYPLEIAGRAIYYFKYKLMVRTGWGIDPRVWQHYFLERKAFPEKWKNWTQEQTAEEVRAIKTLFENRYGRVL